MIRIYCDKANAYLLETEVLTAGMFTLPTVQFTFSSDWDNYGKFAVVRAGSVTSTALLMTENNQITVPASCLKHPGVNLMIGIYGADGSHELPSIWCACGEVLDGVDPATAENWTEATHENVDQMLEYAAQIASNAEEMIASIISKVVTDTTNVGNYGTPAVSVQDYIDTEDENKRTLKFTFANLRGNGIESIVYTSTGDNKGDITITQSNGTVTTITDLEEVFANEEQRQENEANRIEAEEARQERVEEICELAEQAANVLGYMYMEIDEVGHLIYNKTSNVEVDFEIVDDHLMMQVDA